MQWLRGGLGRSSVGRKVGLQVKACSGADGTSMLVFHRSAHGGGATSEAKPGPTLGWEGGQLR